ncbi:Transcriptional regulator [Candidatus Methylobacter favarea]|uniref:Transcriptional regulator n=1 Tax=Candidatus Methylobacter favarea TaxID=2707345 RepID=A0A8S0WGJ0_9GAMM|nr:TetR/AcrR family transcriptional regulator [Candidatus Methylobacter favarea]CAA9889154.1 Transcriptional regulator [Candidatus Methylobacter favarea]
MDKETEKNTRMKSAIQNEILLAALILFAEKGYFNTSLSDITQAAGIKTPSGIYQFFKNKQMIASALYTSILDSLNISIDDIKCRNQKSSEQLRGIVDLLFRLTDDAPYVMQFLLILKTNEFLPEEKPLWETAPFAKFIKIIEAGIKAGEIRNIDPLIGYAYFFGIINNTLSMVLSGRLGKKANAYQSQTWLTAWNAIARK